MAPTFILAAIFVLTAFGLAGRGEVASVFAFFCSRRPLRTARRVLIGPSSSSAGFFVGLREDLGVLGVWGGLAKKNGAGRLMGKRGFCGQVASISWTTKRKWVGPPCERKKRG